MQSRTAFICATIIVAALVGASRLQSSAHEPYVQRQTDVNRYEFTVARSTENQTTYLLHDTWTGTVYRAVYQRQSRVTWQEHIVLPEANQTGR